jgi:hypothetical protein
MANDADTQQDLANRSHFWARVQNALTKVAWEVLQEDPATVHHVERAQYANRVLANPGGTAQQLAPSFVNRPNIFGFDTTYDFKLRSSVTAAGDPDIESQLHTDWNMLAGVI